MRTEVSNTDDVIDSRDVIGRIEELEEERQDLVDELDSAKETLSDAVDNTSVMTMDREEIAALENAVELAKDALSDWDADNADELKALKALADEAGSSPDWEYGESLIRDSYFTEYAQQLADDTGAIDRNANWPVNCIDWEQAAEQLKADYFSVDFDGETYWIRA